MADAIYEYLEKGNGVVDPSEFGGDAHPAVEGAPLLPSDGVLVADLGRKPYRDLLLCSIGVSFRLYLGGRGSRRQCVSFRC